MSKHQADVSSIPQHYIELRLLRYAIAVAEELHFGRAAKRLNLSAPALSKQIKDLETALGYLLFQRRTREVALTPAGSAFVAEARRALVCVERAVDCGYAASRGDTGVLSLGYSPWFRPSVLVGLQAALAERVPKTRLSLHSAFSTTQIDAISKGTLDAGIMELPANEEELETHCIWHEELIIALPENHPLATSNQIDRQHLADEPIIWIAESLQPALHRCLLESRPRLDLSLRIAHEINTVFELFDLVEAGAGIGFVKRSLATRVHHSGVVFRELCGPKLFINTGVACRPDNQSEALRVLITLLRAQPT